MPHTLSTFIRQRSQELGLSLSELCRRAQISRQTLYSLELVPHKLPDLATVVALANTLQLHPLRLLQFVFIDIPQPPLLKQQQRLHDRSAFLRDISYPDGAVVAPGQRFIKVWELQNVGSVPWQDRYLRCMDEDIVVYANSGEALTIAHSLRPDTPRIEMPYTPPGAFVQLSMTFTAPSTPATVLSYWKSYFTDDTPCFPEAIGLWVKVQVLSPLVGASQPR